MEHAVDYLKAKGCHKVSLHTQSVLMPAINLYMKMGFVPEAYLRNQWWGMNFIYMSKWL
jgi:ribosomal protein S18 acetylase RimI-like enzyme